MLVSIDVQITYCMGISSQYWHQLMKNKNDVHDVYLRTDISYLIQKLKWSNRQHKQNWQYQFQSVHIRLYFIPPKITTRHINSFNITWSICITFQKNRLYLNQLSMFTKYTAWMHNWWKTKRCAECLSQNWHLILDIKTKLTK
jgi:hypothetical protein